MWPFVTEEGVGIDTLHYKLGVSDFKCGDSAITLSNQQPQPDGNIPGGRSRGDNSMRATIN